MAIRGGDETAGGPTASTFRADYAHQAALRFGPSGAPKRIPCEGLWTVNVIPCTDLITGGVGAFLALRSPVSSAAKQGPAAVLPLGRAGEPQDVVSFVKRRLDPPHSSVDGQQFAGDGGRSLVEL